MNLKITKIIGCIVAFLICFPMHFVYTWIPNTLTAIFFPVNESIWEHMKILFGSILITGTIEYILLTYFNIKHKNLLSSTTISAILIVPIYLILFLPLYYLIGENMMISITIMFISIAIIKILQYFMMSKLEIANLDFLNIILIISSYIIFAYLTYYPIYNHLFYDTKDEKYGISQHKITK